MFKDFKAVGAVYGVACKDNGKVNGCSDGSVAGSGGYKVVVVMWGLVGLGVSEGWEKGRELPRGLYPDKKRSLLIPF